MGVNGYVSRRQNGTTGYLFKDAHGDVLSIYTSTSTYDAWGEIQTKNESSSFENNPLRYYGQYYDYESDMTYLRARYYDSSIKRFITEDPAKDGSNWYAYCGNNPVMLFDPSGLDYYIFYGKDRTDASKSTEKQLNEKYPDKKVHRILVENEEDFYKNWDAMGFDENGNEVDIDGVFIHQHGSPNYLHAGENGQIYVDKLTTKTIGTIVLTACDTGNLDYSNNVASQLAISQNVDQVIAPDGLGSLLSIGIVSSTYTKEKSDYYGRNGEGFTLFQKISGKLIITPNITKDGTSNYVKTSELLSDAIYLGNQVRLVNQLGYRLILNNWR